MRSITDKEVAVLNQVEQEYLQKGLITRDSDNENLVIAYVEANFESQEITAPAIRQVFEHLRPQLKWKSQAQMDFEKLWARMDQGQRNLFNAWLNTIKRMDKDGETGFQNKVKILEFAIQRGISEIHLNLALTNLAGALSFSGPTPDGPKHEGGYGRHSGAKFEPRDNVRLTIDNAPSGRTLGAWINGRRNHAVQE
jgi:hypothetical protein